MSHEPPQQQQQQRPKPAGATRRCLGAGGMVPPWRAAWELLSCMTRLRDPRRKRAGTPRERAGRATAAVPRWPTTTLTLPADAPAADAVAGETGTPDRSSGVGGPGALLASPPHGKTSPALSRSAGTAAVVAPANPNTDGTAGKGCCTAPERQSDASARPSGLSRLLASTLRVRRVAQPREQQGQAGECSPAVPPCQHEAAGCAHGAASHAERRAHERSCDFRPGSCPCPGAACPWQGPVRDVRAHLQAAHDTIGTLQGESIVFLASGVDLPGSASWAMMQSCLGQTFLLVLEKEPAWGAHAEPRGEPGKAQRARADDRQRGQTRPAPDRAAAAPHPRRQSAGLPGGRGSVQPHGRASSRQEARPESGAAPGRSEVDPAAWRGDRRWDGRDGGRVGPAPRPHAPPPTGGRTGAASATSPVPGRPGPRACAGVSLGPDGCGRPPCQQHFLAAVALIGSPEQARAFSYRLELKAEGARRQRLCWEAPVLSAWDGVPPALAKGGDCLAFSAGLAGVFTAAHSLSIGVRITKH